MKDAARPISLMNIFGIKVFVVAVLCACSILLVHRTLQWPVISDASFMQYAVFLMRHGMRPYKDIIDINMPGAYLMEDLAVSIFGNGALGWRIFDLVLIGLLTAGMVSISRPFGWFPGVFAALLFAVLHWAGGPAQLGQRDLIIAVLQIAAYAFLFSALRKNLWLLTLISGACFGSAASIKPQALLLGLVILGGAAYTLRRRRLPWIAHLGSGVVGVAIPAIVCLVFLWRQHAIPAFLSTLRGLDVYHAGMARHSLGFLIAHAIPSLLLPIAAIAAWLAIENRYCRTWEGAAMLIGVAFGLFSFCLQGKAYPYHRYPLLVFLLLFIAIQLTGALSAMGLQRPAAIAALLFSVVWIAPAATAKTLRYNWRDQSTLARLRSDVTELGGAKLSGRIQCLDTISGCLTVLDRMQIQQATGLLYDCYLFAPEPGSVQEELRRKFWMQIERRQPAVFVVTDDWCFGLPDGYRKLDQWPAFRDLLRDRYALAVQDAPRPGNYKNFATWPFGYRIYIRKR